MSSKLNPNAGAFVPSFVVPIEPTVSVTAPSPGSKKNKTNGQNNGANASKNARNASAKSAPEPANAAVTIPDTSAPIPNVQCISELAECGRIVNGCQYYTIQELLQFRKFCTSIPEGFDPANVHAICGGTVKEKTKNATKREKQRAAAQNQPVLHYDPNAYSYYPPVSEAGNHLLQKVKQRHKPTENPEQEMKTAVEKVHSLLDQLAAVDMTVDTALTLFHEIPVSCSLSLQAVVGVLFDRAIAAPHLSQFYAPFSSALSESMPDFKDGARTINFRRILLTKCYEALVEEPDQASWRRQSMLGNVGLIGDLFRRQLLTENIMHVCVAMMLDSDMESSPSPHVLHAACQLLMLVGDLLDGSSPASRRTMDEYFDALQRMACLDHLKPDLRQLIQETIEARSSGWIRKRVDFPDVLSTTQSV